MSLFVRLWIVGTLTAFVSAAAAIVAFAVITEQGSEIRQNRHAVILGRMVAHAASMDPLGSVDSEGATALLRQRAAELTASGPLLAVAVTGADGQPIADLATPGLEEESVLSTVPTLLEDAARSRMRRIERHDGLIYIALPLIDRREQVRGVIGMAIPEQALRREGDEMFHFTIAAAVIAVALGLLAALILTRQVAWPVRHLAEVAGRLEDAAFDTTRVGELAGRRDEIGRLARVMLRLVQALDHFGRRMDNDASGSRERL